MTKEISIWAKANMWIPQVVIAISLGIFAYYASDRKPPFSIVSVEPASAKPGEYVTLTARVTRDLTRPCGADFSRFLFAKDGARFDLGDSSASPDFIRDLEKRAPGVLQVSVQLPFAMVPGPALLVTALRYHCNLTHHIWPIQVTTSMPFTVLPK